MDRGTVTRALTFSGYALLVACMIVNDVMARRRGRATFARAIAQVAGRPVGKLLLVAGWLWLGWHLFVRRDH